MKMEKLRVFEMFAGYGGASFALKRANINYETIGISEIDQYAIRCFNQNHPGIKNYGDCSKIDTKDLPDFDLLTGGFPCTDVSMAGKRDLSLGRTLLINHVFRIIKDKDPKYLFLENVEGLLLMPKFFDSIRYTLAKLGYSISYKLLKSSNFGIPHTRPRVWMYCRKTPFQFMEKVFPENEKLKLFIKNLLDVEVDKKYYIDKSKIKRIFKYKMNGFENKIHILSNIHEVSAQLGNVFDVNGVLGTLCCMSAGEMYVDTPLRKITSKECFRFMGFLNDEINLDNIPEREQYKMAGNGWEVNLVSKIFNIVFVKYKNL
jgi:DNA (cytosine-5)-methyltransferase 1